MTRPAPIIAGTLAAVLLLFGAYMGAYYEMLQPNIIAGSYDGATYPVYHFSPDPAEDIDRSLASWALLPAHQLDRLIRPGYWD